MQLIEERQYTPFAIACGLAIALGGSVWVLAHLAGADPASVNMLYWRLNRAAGFTAYVLLAASVLLGFTSAGAFWDRWGLRRVMNVTHQYMSLLMLPFLLLHLWGVWMDTDVPFTLAQVLLPFVAAYRPVATGLGVMALYLWVCMVLTSYLRERIGLRVWRALHTLYLPLFLLTTLHGLLDGTDTTQPWAKAVYMLASAVFVLLLIWRSRRQPIRQPGA